MRVCVSECVEKKNSDLVYLLNVVLVPRRDGISADAGIRTWQVDRQASGRSNCFRVDGAFRVRGGEASLVASGGRLGITVDCRA